MYYMHVDPVAGFHGTAFGVMFSCFILMLLFRRVCNWRQAMGVENLLRLAATAMCLLLPIALGFIYDNPGADSNDVKNAIEHRRTLVQIAGGLLGLVALLFAGLKATQAEDRKSTRLNSSHGKLSRMPSSA